MTDKSDERKALAELVACKDLKDRIDSFSHTPECLAAPWTECPQALMEAEYKRRQPAAWANARAVLATAPAEPPEPPKEPPVPYFANDDELRKTLRILDFTLATYGDDDSFPIGARLMRALLYRLQEGHTMSAPEKWRIEAVHASGCIHYTNEMACDCGLLEAARDTFPSPPSGGEVAALLRELREEGEAANRNQAASEDEYPLGFLSTHGDLCLRAADALARLSAPVPDTDVAQNDLRDILRAVGLSDCARPYSPHEVVQRELLPHLRALRNVIEKYDGNSNNPYWAEEFNQAVRIARAYLDKPIKADK